MSESKSYVRSDEHSVMRVEATRVMLDSVVAAFLEGHSPETIRQEFPALSLEEVYGSIAYYLAHNDEVNAYLARQTTVWNGLRVHIEERASPVVERLRTLQRARARLSKLSTPMIQNMDAICDGDA